MYDWARGGSAVQVRWGWAGRLQHVFILGGHAPLHSDSWALDVQGPAAGCNQNVTVNGTDWRQANPVSDVSEAEVGIELHASNAWA